MANENKVEPLQVDIRGLSLEERRMAVAKALEELHQGGAVVLITDRDPRPTLIAFQQMHQGDVECTVSREAADLFRAELKLRENQRTPTLAEHLRADHARIDSMLTEMQHYLRVGALAEAEVRFADLGQALSRHMAAEEEILYPAMQQMSESVAQAVPAMLAEHGELRSLLPELAEALGKQDVLAMETLLPQIRRSLARHHEDEERLVYPITEWALAPSDQERLAWRLGGG
jgi:hemerythrin superfamily protein